jgi:hypothetical protein
MNLSVTGSAVTAGLLADGHTVRAHVRSISSADRLPAGAGHVSGDLGDVAWLRASTDESDGVVHAAYATSGSFDVAFLDVAPSALSALAGSDRPLVYTGGTWVHGSRDPITEESPGQPTADGRPAPGNPATVADRGRRWHPNGRHRPGRRVRCRRRDPRDASLRSHHRRQRADAAVRRQRQTPRPPATCAAIAELPCRSVPEA